MLLIILLKMIRLQWTSITFNTRECLLIELSNLGCLRQEPVYVFI